MTSAEFKAALQAADLTRRALALALGVHVVTVNRWACGLRDVPQYAAAYLRDPEQRLTIREWLALWR